MDEDTKRELVVVFSLILAAVIWTAILLTYAPLPLWARLCWWGVGAIMAYFLYKWDMLKGFSGLVTGIFLLLVGPIVATTFVFIGILKKWRFRHNTPTS